ncbi:hypothetical protein BHE74_00058015, partial [Ensete ventricosum]
MHRVDTFGNWLGVCWKLAEDIRSLLGWHKGVRQKKTKTRWKIIEVRTIRWDLDGSSLGDSPKELGSSLETRREIAVKKIGGLTARSSEVAGVCR